jgi:hypothetical protein
MKTAGIIIFTIDLLNALYSGLINVKNEKVVDLGKLEIIKDNKHTVNWQPYIGMGIMVIGSIVLILSRKKSGNMLKI